MSYFLFSLTLYQTTQQWLVGQSSVLHRNYCLVSENVIENICIHKSETGRQHKITRQNIQVHRQTNTWIKKRELNAFLVFITRQWEFYESCSLLSFPGKVCSLRSWNKSDGRLREKANANDFHERFRSRGNDELGKREAPRKCPPAESRRWRGKELLIAERRRLRLRFKKITRPKWNGNKLYKTQHWNWNLNPRHHMRPPPPPPGCFPSHDEPVIRSGLHFTSRPQWIIITKESGCLVYGADACLFNPPWGKWTECLTERKR